MHGSTPGSFNLFLPFELFVCFPDKFTYILVYKTHYIAEASLELLPPLPHLTQLPIFKEASKETHESSTRCLSTLGANPDSIFRQSTLFFSYLRFPHMQECRKYRHTTQCKPGVAAPFKGWGGQARGRTGSWAHDVHQTNSSLGLFSKQECMQ